METLASGPASIMETLKFIAYLVAMPVCLWLLVELIDHINRMWSR